MLSISLLIISVLFNLVKAKMTSKQHNDCVKLNQTRKNTGNIYVNSNGKIVLNFHRTDLVALYVTVSLKRIVVDGLVWKPELDELVEEVETCLKTFSKDVKISLFYAIRDFSRVYADQWSVQSHGYETGQPLFQTLMLVFCFRLGMHKMWIPNGTHFREDILIDGYLSHKPALELRFLSQGDPLYELLLPLCPNLFHIVLPMCDNSVFMNAVKIKSLRVLEFSTGVSDKVLCQALWNIDKKCEKVLQIMIKDKGKSCTRNLVLPDLEILKSNILKGEGVNSMKLAFGAVALLLQPKLRIIENERNWGTFEAINCIRDMENRFRMKNTKLFPAIKQLRIEPTFDQEELEDQLDRAVEMCPSVNHFVFLHYAKNLTNRLAPFYKSLPLDRLENLALDLSGLNSVKEFSDILAPFTRIKYLTLKISFAFLSKFSLQDECISERNIYPDPIKYPAGVGNLKSLSLVIVSDCAVLKKNFKSNKSNSMISFLYRFSNIESLHFYNTLELPPAFVVYGCIGGALAVMNHLKNLSIVGSNKHFPSAIYNDACRDLELSYLLPELLDETTFKLLKNLNMFTLDEYYITKGVDHFLEALRTVDVFVRIIYRPSYLKNKKVEAPTATLFKAFLGFPLGPSEINNKVTEDRYVDIMDIDLEESVALHW